MPHAVQETVLGEESMMPPHQIESEEESLTQRP